MTITHIAGLDITVQDRYLRQRCAWCGVVLLNYDLTNTAVAGDVWTPPATWPPGRLITVDGPVSTVLEPDARLPDDACGLDHPELTL